MEEHDEWKTRLARVEEISSRLKANYGDDLLCDQLLSYADDPRWQVRMAVARAITHVKPEALCRFLRLTEDPNSFVENTAKASMRQSGMVFSRNRRKIEAMDSAVREFEEVRRRYGAETVERVRAVCRKVMMRDIAQVGHDIRNIISPLGDDLQAVFALLDGPMSADDRTQARGLIQQMQATAQQLENICGAIHLYSRDIPDTRTAEVLANIVREAHGMVAANFRSHRQDINCVSVTIDVPGDLVCQVLRESMLRVFQNLLKNAYEAFMTGPLTFRPGAVSVTAVSCGDGVKVEIRDNGRGMSDRELRRVSTFEPNGCTLKPGGTGFGMSIVHKIVSAHGGTVEMSSAKQVGTVVTVYLPYKGK